MECFCRLEFTNVQRVFFALLAKHFFTLLQRRAKYRIAIACQNDFPRAEVEGNDANMQSVNGETINNALGDILLLHGLQHPWNDSRTGNVVL